MCRKNFNQADLDIGQFSQKERAFFERTRKWKQVAFNFERARDKILLILGKGLLIIEGHFIPSTMGKGLEDVK